jgi:hypothetical protein
VEDDGVGCLGVSERGRQEESAEREGFHGWECIRVTPPLADIAQSLPIAGVRAGLGLQSLHSKGYAF